ncbi:MAG: hypothetical protein GDA36_06050 [Rhodobacteraceae bacterium]|nr:hypothetical protein [Paracoccaceae bacterium]
MITTKNFGVNKMRMRNFLVVASVMLVYCTTALSQSMPFIAGNLAGSTTATARGNTVTMYSNPPSKIFGNLFNPSEDFQSPASESPSFEILSDEIFPGISGNQVWLELQLPSSGENNDDDDWTKCVEQSCWTYFGKEDDLNNNKNNYRLEWKEDSINTFKYNEVE